VDPLRRFIRHRGRGGFVLYCEERERGIGGGGGIAGVFSFFFSFSNPSL